MKKPMLQITTPVVALIMATATLFSVGGCANFVGQVQQIESADQLRADLIWVGGRTKQYVSDANKAKIHQFAVALQSTANLDLGPLFALLPQTTGNTYLDVAIGTAKTVLQLAVLKWGSSNGTTLAYAHAAADALLQNF